MEYNVASNLRYPDLECNFCHAFNPMKTIAAASAKITITLVLFYFIFRTVDVGAFVSTLRNAGLETLLAGFTVLWIGHCASVFRWRMLMRPLIPVMSYRRIFGIYCMGLFFNLAFPTTVGGDVAKVYYAGKPFNAYARSFAATFLDRDTGLLALLAIACASTLLYPVSVPGIPIALIIWCLALVFVFGNVILFAPGIHRWIVLRVRRIGLAKMASKVDAVSNAFQITAKHRTILAGSIALSILSQFLYIAVVWFIAKGLGLNIPLPYVLTFVPVITIITMVPVSLNGIGLREYAFLSLFGSMGVAPASCIALGLILSLLITLSSIPGGIVYIAYRHSGKANKLASMQTGF